VLSFFVFFCHSYICCLSLVSYDSKLMEKIIHRSTVLKCVLLSDYITIMTSSSRKGVCMFRIKFPTKRINLFRIFPIFRTHGMAQFCNLYIERPSYNECTCICGYSLGFLGEVASNDSWVVEVRNFHRIVTSYICSETLDRICRSRIYPFDGFSVILNFMTLKLNEPE